MMKTQLLESGFAGVTILTTSLNAMDIGAPGERVALHARRRTRRRGSRRQGPLSGTAHQSEEKSGHRGKGHGGAGRRAHRQRACRRPCPSPPFLPAGARGPRLHDILRHLLRQHRIPSNV
mgnify:CR=1 FL=1